MAQRVRFTQQEDQDLITLVCTHGELHITNNQSWGRVGNGAWRVIENEMRALGHDYTQVQLRGHFNNTIMQNQLLRREALLRNTDPNNRVFDAEVQADPAWRIAMLAGIEIGGITTNRTDGADLRRSPSVVHAAVPPPRVGAAPSPSQSNDPSIKAESPDWNGGASLPNAIPAAAGPQVHINNVNSPAAGPPGGAGGLLPGNLLNRLQHQRHLWDVAVPRPQIQRLAGDPTNPNTWPLPDPVVAPYVLGQHLGNRYQQILNILTNAVNEGRATGDMAMAGQRVMPLVRQMDMNMLDFRGRSTLGENALRRLEQRVRLLYHALGIIPNMLRDSYAFDGMVHDWYGPGLPLSLVAMSRVRVRPVSPLPDVDPQAVNVLDAGNQNNQPDDPHGLYN
ncbi:uncharacterized protein JN550_012930 [Neoarthrinium moseri]|uniref:uncharacterized protein n=1 Tax=Neoarthrinium moseri TaxID=1658444 RepID=UPI001FDAD2E6|nr:uncharacterized protein JN550_012930 [Neoarthrinium moseri]KAI1858037.1 hypothetical protein JN550_012930 [Neoarthrinium moseri]